MLVTPYVTLGSLFEKVGLENNHLLTKGNKNIWILGISGSEGKMFLFEHFFMLTVFY